MSTYRHDSRFIFPTSYASEEKRVDQPFRSGPVFFLTLNTPRALSAPYLYAGLLETAFDP